MGAVEAAEGSAEGLNALAADRLREAFGVISAREQVASWLSGADGALEGAEALEAGFQVANFLGYDLGRWEESRRLLEVVANGYEREYGADASQTMHARTNLATAMGATGAVVEAR
eukprot:COSAG05_NODE_10988_length_536_cov_0.711670_1_plen_115_part_10